MQQTWVGKTLEESMEEYSLQYSCLENPHGQKSLMGYSPRGPKDLDMTEQLSRTQHNTEVAKAFPIQYFT